MSILVLGVAVEWVAQIGASAHQFCANLLLGENMHHDENFAKKASKKSVKNLYANNKNAAAKKAIFAGTYSAKGLRGKLISGVDFKPSSL